MKNTLICLIGFLLITLVACNNGIFSEVEIPEFDFPESIIFNPKLSDYNIFEGNASDLIPSSDFELLELSSTLFTDFSQKQRLVKIPSGTKMNRLNDGSIDFPDGTILTKTFFYYNDERDESLGKRIIETRLLIKEADIWNIATYVWNEDQSEALLELNGDDTNVSWIDSNGNNISTLYHIPDENECIACHQSNSEMIPLGTKLRNLNRNVERDGNSLNQLSYLQSVGILGSFEVSMVSEIVDFKDASNGLADRARAYLELNCAHCHNPDAWDESANEDYDFRYETTLDDTGISSNRNRITGQLSDMEMPFIGTTLLDQEGVDLVTEFIEGL